MKGRAPKTKGVRGNGDSQKDEYKKRRDRKHRLDCPEMGDKRTVTREGRGHPARKKGRAVLLGAFSNQAFL